MIKKILKWILVLVIILASVVVSYVIYVYVTDPGRNVMEYAEKEIRVGMKLKDACELIVRNSRNPYQKIKPNYSISIWDNPNYNGSVFPDTPELPVELKDFKWVPNVDGRVLVNNSGEMMVIFTPMDRYYPIGKELFSKNILVITDFHYVPGEYIEEYKSENIIKKIYIVNEDFKIIKKIAN